MPSRPVPLLVVALVLVVFGQTWGHDFVTGFDDSLYVTENPVVQRGLTLEGLRWAFVTGHGATWVPLTWLSHMLDVELFGLHAGGHHLMSALLHALNAVLLFFVLRDMTGSVGRSTVVALLFAVHPLRVESVAWVSERKDVLSGFFWIAGTGAWARYARRPGKGRYALVALCMAVGMMCKQMLVTLPFALLLLDFWPLRRCACCGADAGTEGDHCRSVRALVVEKLPLLAISILGSVAAVLSQHRGAEQSTLELELLSLPARLANAVVSYSDYLRKTVWPSDLAAFYPHPGEAFSIAALGVGLAVLVAISAWTFAWRGRAPYLLVGWLWFLGTLVPVIGVLKFGLHGMADRFTYIPHIGLLVAIVWGVSALLESRARGLLPVLGAVAVAALTVLSIFQVRTWRDTETVFAHAAEAVEDNHLAHYNLGLWAREHGDGAGARRHFEEALRIEPDDFWSNVNLGGILLQEGRAQDAAVYLARAVELDPDAFEARANLGHALASAGELAGAAQQLERAIALRPDEPTARQMLVGVLIRLGRAQEAERHLRELRRLAPQNEALVLQLAQVLAMQSDFAGARAELEGALARRPKWPEGYQALGRVLDQSGDPRGASEAYRKAIALSPSMATAHYALAGVLERGGERDAALAAYREAERCARAAGQAALLAEVRARLDALGAE